MVPERTVIDFDHHSAEFGSRSTEALREQRERCPLGFSAEHGGYWAVFGHAAGMQVFRRADAFSTAKWVDEEGRVRGGLAIPTIEGLDLVPNELDPPEWHDYRRLLNPVFAPKAVERLRPRTVELVGELVDEFVEAGEADLVAQFANLAPALVTVDFLGLNRSDLGLFSDPFHRAMWAPAGSPDWLEAIEGFRRMPAVLMEAVEARRAAPRDDYISALVRMRIGDELLGDDDLIKILMQLLAGGVDSTAALLANVFVHLDDHPEDRARLRDDADLLKPATEEFVRFFTPIQSVARTATKPVDVAGRQVCPREPVMLSMASMNRDAAVFDDPDRVVLDRWPNRHVGFGLGLHRCLGSNFARMMFQESLTAILRRLPDYRVDRERAVRYGSMAQINGWVSVPVTFTPGCRTVARTPVAQAEALRDEGRLGPTR